MRISSVIQPFQAEIRKIDGSKKIEEKQKSRAATLDRSEISSKGQRLSETNEQINVLSAQVASQPDIRAEKVAEVQEKIKNGFYNSPEFIDQLATKLMQEFGLGGTSNA